MNEPPQFRRFMTSTGPIDLEGIDWDAIPDHPIPADVLRVLLYMQDVESHTVVFPRTFFSKRALEDEYVGPFLICWLYEEGMHGRALSKFLDRAGHPVPPRTHGRTTLRDHIDRAVTRMMSTAWKDFLALHMTWGAVHECTTIQAYRRLSEQNDLPVLNELLRRIIRDEARHFAFYMWQAEERLAHPNVARTVRVIMNRFYTPVGSSHQPDPLARCVSGFLFNGDEGQRAAQHVDQRPSPSCPDSPASPSSAIGWSATSGRTHPVATPSRLRLDVPTLPFRSFTERGTLRACRSQASTWKPPS